MNRVIVNADQPGPTIDKHVYGHFAEHLGRCVYDGMWVGEESPIPNVRGIRSDVVEALKQIKVPVIRWPGGCFADEYHWGDGIVFGAVWDLDGTLVDTEMNHFVAWGALLREHDRALTHEEFRPTFGLRNDDILVHHFGFEAVEDSIAGLGERKEELYRLSLVNDGVRMQAGARQLVEHFHTLGSQQAIASSAPPANIDLTMHLIGLRGYFDAVVSSEEVTRGKPAPDLILRAAERLNLPPCRLVVLEDAPAGVAAGKAAGSRVIAIDSTFATEKLSAADLTVHSFEEVIWTQDRWQAFFAS
ncbi:MAG: HAD-IA family hydrolase [Chloroflexota bacterium]|nr:MAG: hypothetical protein DLM70_13215 [Chloroflexota bacterium]